MRLAAPLRQAGTKRRCPRCQFVFQVPTEAEVAKRRRKVEEYGVSEGAQQPPPDNRRYVSVKCPLCNTLLKATDDQVGRQLTCPDCETRVVVPPLDVQRQQSDPAAPVEGYALSEEVDESDTGARAADQMYYPVHCPSCDTLMKVTASQVGQEIACPDCRVPMVVPPVAVLLQKKSGSGFVPAGEAGEYGILEGADQPAADSRLAHQAYIAVDCPICNTLLHFTEDQVGCEEVCPDCGRSLIVPEAPMPVRKIDPRIEAGNPYKVSEEEEAIHPAPLFAHSRRRVRPGAAGDDGAVVVPTPPRRPFLSGVFQFPIYRNVWLRWLGTSLSAAVVLGLVGWTLQTGQSRDFFSLLSAIFVLGVVATLAMVWTVVTLPSLMAILIDTAFGYDRVENWPEGSFGDLIGETLFAIAGVFLSLMPAGCILYALGTTNLWSGPYLPASFGVLFPVVMLSMLETNSPMNPLSPPVWRSISTVWRAWAVFYLETIPLVIGCWYGVQAFLLATFPGRTLPASLLLVAGLMIYFRLLGRLAWKIQSMPIPGNETQTPKSPHHT